MKFNVNCISWNQKALPDGDEVKTLINSMPSENSIYSISDPNSDRVLMFSCPFSFKHELEKDNAKLVTWFGDYVWWEGWGGAHWDGRTLKIKGYGKWIDPWEWTKIIEEELQ